MAPNIWYRLYGTAAPHLDHVVMGTEYGTAVLYIWYHMLATINATYDFTTSDTQLVPKVVPQVVQYSCTNVSTTPVLTLSWPPYSRCRDPRGGVFP